MHRGEGEEAGYLLGAKIMVVWNRSNGGGSEKCLDSRYFSKISIGFWSLQNICGRVQKMATKTFLPCIHATVI